MRFASCRRARRNTPTRRRVGVSTLAAAGRLAIRPKTRSEACAIQDSLVLVRPEVSLSPASGRVRELIGGTTQASFCLPPLQMAEELLSAAWYAAASPILPARASPHLRHPDDERPGGSTQVAMGLRRGPRCDRPSTLYVGWSLAQERLAAGVTQCVDGAGVARDADRVEQTSAAARGAFPDPPARLDAELERFGGQLFSQAGPGRNCLRDGGRALLLTLARVRVVLGDVGCQGRSPRCVALAPGSGASRWPGVCERGEPPEGGV